MSSYDVVIVGAGPAGLSAARTSARLGFRTLLVERLSDFSMSPGLSEFDMVPWPGAEEPAAGAELYYPEVDLRIPASAVISRVAHEHCLGPAGRALVPDTGSRAAVVDRLSLLRMLAEQAQAAGAELVFDTEVSGLLYQDGRVAGVRSTLGDLTAEIVIAAEGTDRRLCEQAGLYGGALLAARHALVLSQDLQAPMVRAPQVGRILTFGQRYTSAPEAFGQLFLPAPGRATMTLTILSDELSCAAVESAWRFLAQYANDPRICSYLEGASVVRRSSHLVPFGEAPITVARSGFVGAGDAITPSGNLGVLPAVYLGRQAAMAAAAAVDDGDDEALQSYARLAEQQIMPGLLAEQRTLEAVLEMSDHELDRACHVLGLLQLSIPLPGTRHEPAPQAAYWLMQQVPLAPDDGDVLARLLEAQETDDSPYVMPAPVPVEAFEASLY